MSELTATSEAERRAFVQWRATQNEVARAAIIKGYTRRNEHLPHLHIVAARAGSNAPNIMTVCGVPLGECTSDDLESMIEWYKAIGQHEARTLHGLFTGAQAPEAEAPEAEAPVGGKRDLHLAIIGACTEFPNVRRAFENTIATMIDLLVAIKRHDEKPGWWARSRCERLFREWQYYVAGFINVFQSRTGTIMTEAEQKELTGILDIHAEQKIKYEAAKRVGQEIADTDPTNTEPANSAPSSFVPSM